MVLFQFRFAVDPRDAGVQHREGGAITSEDPASFAWRDFVEAYREESDKFRPGWIWTNDLREFLIGTEPFASGGAEDG